MTRANPKLVGSFIIGGVLLLLLAVAALVSGTFLTKSTTFVSFFPESVRGLQIGSPVTFRGVPLGQVTGIEAFMAGKERGIDIQVTYKVNLDRIHGSAGVMQQLQSMSAEEAARMLSEKGLRAELLATSLVTGQLYIDLDFHPDLPPRVLDVQVSHPQIPTAPTKLQLIGNRLEKLANAVSDLPLDEIARNLSDTLVAIRDLARSQEIRSALASAGAAGKDLSRTLESVDRLVGEVRGKVRDADVQQVIADLHRTLDAAEKGLLQIQQTIAGTSGAQREFTHTLSEIARAAAAVRVLAEYLERNPSALVEGKPAPGK
ncbi:MAG TPA: MlaD family protein [Anaeromyxobacteraceae bacterium]|jgi:paraquat-inducible protein B|nr:MlaD family protein [Anaeromyxobacteraceae bacterium]